MGLGTMKAEGKTGAELFKAATKGKAGIAEEAFVAFVKSLNGRAPSETVPECLQPDIIDEAQVKALFAHVASGSEVISEDNFIRSMTVLYKRVIKTTVISEEAAIDSKSSRKLEPGEVLETFEVPVTEGDGSLKRLRCKACQDGQEGWVTLEGSKGSVFLESVGAYYTCLKEAALALGAEVGAKTKRKIAKGENAQMLEPEKKDAACGVMRMKVRMLRDEETGWVTTTGSKDDNKFFEPC